MTSSDAICLEGKVSEAVNWKNLRGGGMGGSLEESCGGEAGGGGSPLERSGDLMRVLWKNQRI